MKIISGKYFNLIIVGLLAAAFFIATSSFNYLTQTRDYTKWSSPDETANYFFSKKFSETDQLAFFDPAAVLGDNLVMPRSFRSDAGWLKPVSFLGIILIYGKIGALLGSGVIPFLTPFLAALGIIIFYLLVKKIFKSERVALWSAFILATFPVYIYYTVRSLFHNILFIVLLLAGTYLLALVIGEKKEKLKTKFLSLDIYRLPWLDFLLALLAGIFFGLAIITRTSELLWLLPTLFLVWLFYARRLGFIKLSLFSLGLLLALLPAAYWNTILYQSPFYGGYNAMNRSLFDLSRSGGDILKLTFAGQLDQYRQIFQNIAHNIFYFGFNASQSISMFRHYVLDMFPIIFWSGLLGLLLLIVQNIRRFQKKYLVYILSGLILGIILVFYYGSWKFNDNPDPTHFTIGNSYTRYWLPMYLMIIPLASLAIVRFTRALLLMRADASKRLQKLAATGLQAAAVLIIAAFGLYFVMFGSEEGLSYLYYNVMAEKVNTKIVMELTKPEGIIITRYYDKFFFPERRVIMGTIPDDEILKAATKLVQVYPLYYYNFYLNPDDIAYLNERKLSIYDLELQLVKKVNAKFGLYQFNYKKHVVEQ